MSNNYETVPIDDFVEKSYLDYSMYVILDRALPHLSDGLKPVQRRIVYAMSELGLSAVSKPKKSARTVGDVLGKYHPHGDSACYEAMVLMAQPFSYRYPIVHGQGNWGTIDEPKSFAAMRYTESKLAKYAQVLLRELGQGTVDWQPNYDGTTKEPTRLPALLPNILLNGGMGIAVGMSTDIPPHNVRDVAKACLHLIDKPNASVSELATKIQGPDYPTYGELITPRHELRQMYSMGTGSIKLRATYEIIDKTIVITSLPYQTASSKILEQIATQMHAKKLPMIEDLRDESDEESPVRLVLFPRSNRVDLEQVMNHLFATTDLEKNYRVNLNMIGLDGRPQVKDLFTILSEWLTFRFDTTRRRLQYRLDAVEKRLHLLEGLLIAFLNLDEVIRIIREEDEPKTELIRAFHLSDAQAEYILETKLRHLARLEEMKIRDEQQKLAKERDGLAGILGNADELRALVREELANAAKEFDEPRRTLLIERDTAKAFDESALTPSETVTIVLSKMGWVRLAKGANVEPETMSYKTGDAYQHHVSGKSNQQAVFFADDGRTYSLPAYSLPSARGFGEPLSSQLTLGTRKLRYCLLDNVAANYLFTNERGYGFISRYEYLLSRQKAGKSFMTLSGTQANEPLFVPKNAQFVLLVSSDDYVLVLNLSDIPELPKGKGNKLINIPPKAAQAGVIIKDMLVLNGDETLKFKVGRKKTPITPEQWQQWQADRAKRGTRLPADLQGYKAIELG